MGPLPSPKSWEPNPVPRCYSRQRGFFIWSQTHTLVAVAVVSRRHPEPSAKDPRMDVTPDAKPATTNARTALDVYAIAASRNLRTLCNAGKILLQQIKRNGQQNDIFHQEGDIPDHRGKSSGRGRPAVGHEGNNRNRRNEGKH